MRSLRAVWVMTIAFTKRYFRSKVALFFTFLFPVIFLVIFGGIFGSDSSPSFNVALINNASSEFSSEFIENTSRDELFSYAVEESFEGAKEKLGRGEVDAIVVLPETFGVVSDKEYPKGTLELFYDQGDEQLAGTIQAVLSGIFDQINNDLVPSPKPFVLDAQPLQTADLSQFDYTLAGLIGFSILSLGIFSMAEGFTGDKKLGALRRMQVSPIKPWQLITATALNRILVGLMSVALMFGFAVVVFDFNMRGDYLSFLLFSIISITCLFGFGMAIAGWAKDSNQAAPLANLVSFPMMFLSGVFFPRFLMPETLQNVTEFIPLSPVVDGLRLILTEGKTIFELGPQLAIIGGWIVVIYFVAFKVFRWE